MRNLAMALVIYCGACAASSRSAPSHPTHDFPMTTPSVFHNPLILSTCSAQLLVVWNSLMFP